jgi:23S rRNA pseudouridine2605 synthase
MRLNQFIARATGMSRRQADAVIGQGRVRVNGLRAHIGQIVDESDSVTLEDQPIDQKPKLITILLNKPVGYVCSRNGQGSATVYDLLPSELYTLKPVGRLDKDSSGLLLMTNDGDLANQMTHPRFAKTKVYEVSLDKPLDKEDSRLIQRKGVQLEDGLSRFDLAPLDKSHYHWQVSMQEGRNRQIRRTFQARGYDVMALLRTNFGPYELGDLPEKQYRKITRF